MRIGASFIFLALWLLTTTFVLWLDSHQPLCWTLVWPSTSLLMVGMAYLRGWPGLFGKDAQGKLPAWRILVLLPFFAVTVFVWHVLRKRPGPPCHLAAPRLWIGRRPLAGELPTDVRWVVDLTAEFSRSVPETHNLTYETLPILDGYVLDDEPILDLARRIANYPETVYVHCAQGHGRAAMLTAVVLVARGQVPNVAEAERMLIKLRPGVHLTSPQRRLLARIEPKLRLLC